MLVFYYEFLIFLAEGEWVDISNHGNNFFSYQILIFIFLQELGEI